MPKRTTPSKPKTGTLRIGDQWNAINIIARSQTHPLKAVCELAENAIDAHAKYIQIVRRRTKGNIYLELADDGKGVLSDDSGEPDFGRIATHVCDSMKRHLNAGERAGIHGEFGIGLLSFWSLGDELRMVCAGLDGRLFELLLQRGKRTYAVRHVRGALATGGTRVVVGPLLENTRKVVTGEKLVRYLSSELRDRIRSSGVQIRVVDRVSRKEALVEPREFEGDRVDVSERLPTAFGDVAVELYFREASSGGGDAGVAICKDGTRVLRDITELVSFQYAPWTDSRVEGILDFGAFELAPGTRGGIVPDERLTAFAVAIKEFEPSLVEAIEMREQAQTDKASRDILKQVHRAFRNALRELPSNEYVFFDIPELRPQAGSPDHSNRQGEGLDALPLAAQTAPAREDADLAVGQPLLPLEAGPLAAVRITPRHARRVPGKDCQLTAVARDEHGLKIDAGVHYEWRLVEGEGVLRAENDHAHFNSSTVSQLLVEVVATQEDISATDRVSVKFVDDAHQGDDDSAKGLPSYRLEAEQGKPWRSRYHVQKNEIVINSAHRDFVSSRSTATKHRRYIGKLYAKEVVLINFPHESPAQVMERLIQITLRTEDVL